MGWKDYLKEDAKYDKEQREIARDVFKKIKAHLKQEAEGKGSTLRVLKKYKGFALEVGKIDSDYTDLHLIFTPSKQEFNGFGKTPSGLKVIMINSLLDDFSTKYMDTRFKEKIFVHEFIHYLDDKRIGFIKKSPSKMYDDGNVKDYFNTPQEFNAYYQEGISTLDFTMNKKLNNLQSKFKVEFLKSPENFYKFAMGSFFPPFIKHLSDKNMKKLKKRLYGLYVMIKEKYSEI